MKADYTWSVLGVVAIVAFISVLIAVSPSGSPNNPSNASDNTGQQTSGPEAPAASAPVAESNPATQPAPAQAAVQTNTQSSSTYTEGQSLCSKEAQKYANDLSTPNAYTTNSGIPTSAYFLVSSHYAASQDSCYFVLHNESVEQTQQYGRLVSDIYTLYVGGMPTTAMLQSEAALGTSGFVESPVASCNVQTSPDYSAVLEQSYGTNGSRTSCTYEDPEETRGAGGYGLWLPRYNYTNAPPMSYADFQSLKAQDMVVN